LPGTAEIFWGREGEVWVGRVVSIGLRFCFDLLPA
jgi:hypothetical protein